MPRYEDLDYEQFTPADLDLDIHWIQLPKATFLARQHARQAALEQQRLATQPPDHQVILVPADPTYAPKQGELWPIINHAVQGVLKSHPGVHRQVVEAVHLALDEFRGWRNPYPVCLDYPDKPIARKSAGPR